MAWVTVAHFGVRVACCYQLMPLSDPKVRNLKPTDKLFKVADGHGLYVMVRPNGTKLWQMAYRFDGRQKTLSFGRYPAVTLAMARRRRESARALLAQNLDPSDEVRLAKANRKRDAADTFGAIADELIAKRAKEGLADTTLDKKRWLIGLVRPSLGNRPIKRITAPDVLAVLRKVEDRGTHETAKRLRTIIGEVFRYAVATARADIDPTYALRGALISPKVRHMPAITTRNAFSGLIRAIWNYRGDPSTMAALKLMALLYPRPGELRLAKWPELDFNSSTWVIPAARMKLRKEHRKPLSVEAVRILLDLRQLTGQGDWVFPSLLSRGKPISENTLNGALRRMGFTQDEMTSHGFRSSASSLLNESGLWNYDAIEAEIAHAGGDQIRRIYNRATYWDERARMAEWWAGQVEGMRAAGN